MRNVITTSILAVALLLTSFVIVDSAEAAKSELQQKCDSAQARMEEARSNGNIKLYRAIRKENRLDKKELRLERKSERHEDREDRKEDRREFKDGFHVIEDASQEARRWAEQYHKNNKRK